MAVVARRKKQLWALVIAFGLIAGACSDGSDETQDSIPTTDPGDVAGGGSEPETEPEDEPEDEPDPELTCGGAPDGLPDLHLAGDGDIDGEPVIEDHLITIPTDDVEELRFLPRINEPLSWQVIVTDEEPRLGILDSSETVPFSQLLEAEYPTLFGLAEPLTGAALDRWNLIEDRISTVYLPNRDAELVLSELRELGVDANPVHIVFPSNHIGAYPGASPVTCTWPGWEEPASDQSASGRRIGVVDTGLLPAQGWATYAENHPTEAAAGCVASHGHFIESIIRQIAPDAEVVSTNGFELVTDGGWSCWRSNEFLIRAATTALPLDRLDALNFSFGSELYVTPDGSAGSEPVTFTEILAMVWETNPGITVYAAAGNMLSRNRVYPAALPGVIGVAAVSPSVDWVLWDSDTTSASKVPLDDESDKDDQIRTFDSDSIPYDWIDVYAPGCDLIADGTGVAGEVVVWSGSSFATPVAAALGTAESLDQSKFVRSDGYDLLPESLFQSDLPIDSQCG